MGQYYFITNLDKEQFLHPHQFGEGLKLMEFGCSSMGVLTGLSILLADGNDRGSGDLHSESEVIGSWAGDRIVVAGDYADDGKFLTEEQIFRFSKDHPNELAALRRLESRTVNLYGYATYYFEEISGKVLTAMADDAYILRNMQKRANYVKGWNGKASICRYASKGKEAEEAEEAEELSSLRPDTMVLFPREDGEESHEST